MLAAVKKFRCQGVQLKAGDVITDALPAELERQLVEHRFARHVDPTATDDQVAAAVAVRPGGAGRGGRRTKPATA